jgi:hypothetical protein
LNQKSDASANITVSGSGNTFHFGNLGVGGHWYQNAWYRQKMATHGTWYWLIHFIVALAAAAAWEYHAWLFHLFGVGANR